MNNLELKIRNKKSRISIYRDIEIQNQKHKKIFGSSLFLFFSFLVCIFYFLFLVFGFSAFAAYPRRIVSGIPSVTEMLFALGLGDRIVGVTTNCNYPPEALKKEKVGGFFLNLEKIVSLKPDLIVMLEDAQKQDIQKFKRYGLPVYTINPRTVEEVMSSLLELGKITGKEKKAKTLVQEMKKKIARVRKDSRKFVFYRPRVLVVVGYNPLIVAGGGTFIDDIIVHAGGVNIARQAKVVYPQYSFEQLFQENPEFIIIAEGVVSKEEMKQDSRWQKIDAVKNDRVLFVDADIISRPGPRVVEAIEKIAKFLHPENG